MSIFSSNSKGKNTQETRPPSVIGSRAIFEGNIHTEGEIRIDGKLFGTLVCKGVVVVGPSGYIEGNVDANEMRVAGAIQGELNIRELLTLQNTGKVLGNVLTRKLHVDVGATLTGNIEMGKEAEDKLRNLPIPKVVKNENALKALAKADAPMAPTASTRSASAPAASPEAGAKNTEVNGSGLANKG